MAELTKLSDAEILKQLNTLDDWSLNQGKLYKEYKFKDFVAAFAFMTQVAEAAESVNHHPEWFNVYDTVRISLSSHDVGGISQNDFNLARKIEEIAKG